MDLVREPSDGPQQDCRGWGDSADAPIAMDHLDALDLPVAPLFRSGLPNLHRLGRFNRESSESVLAEGLFDKAVEPNSLLSAIAKLLLRRGGLDALNVRVALGFLAGEGDGLRLCFEY
jgi:hypothetical protein